MSRSASILDGSLDDKVDFFDEVNKKLTSNYVQWFQKEQKEAEEENTVAVEQ